MWLSKKKTFLLQKIARWMKFQTNTKIAHRPTQATKYRVCPVLDLCESIGNFSFLSFCCCCYSDEVSVNGNAASMELRIFDEIPHDHACDKDALIAKVTTTAMFLCGETILSLPLFFKRYFIIIPKNLS